MLRLLVAFTTYDGHTTTIAEDVYWWCAAEGIRRGLNVLAVDLPGDTATRIEKPNVMIEGAGDRGLLSVVDYALARPDVDSESLFVYGISMGGYRAGRLAQIDDRATGIIANAPMLDASGVLVKDTFKAPKQAHGWAYRMLWQYGVDSTQPLKNALEELVDGVWGRFVVDPSEISVPFLTMAGENELGHEGIRQAKAFHMSNGSSAKELRITTVEGAGAHCSVGQLPPRTADRLRLDRGSDTVLGTTIEVRAQILLPSFAHAPTASCGYQFRT